MKLGVGIFEGIPLEETLDLAKAAGFDAVFSDETAAADRTQMARWREGCDRRGLYLETAHCSLAEARGLCIPGEEGDDEDDLEPAFPVKPIDETDTSADGADMLDAAETMGGGGDDLLG